MSYRSFKRMLGETSLERKCRFLFGACLLFLITSSFWWYGIRTEQLVESKTTSIGAPLVQAFLLQKHFEKWRPTDQDSIKKDIDNYAIPDLVKNLKTFKYDSRFLKPFPIPNKDEDAEDDQEREILNYFAEHRPPLPDDERRTATAEDSRLAVEHRERRLPEKSEYRYYQPIYLTDETCSSCHHHHNSAGASTNLGSVNPMGPPLKLGDLIAVMIIKIPDAETQKALNWNRAILLATAIITVFLAMIASYIIVRYVIVKPLKHLRDVSDAVSHGNTDLRAEIHTADEFEELAVAFNRMLRGLVDAQEELKQVNGSLDGKVDELAQANMRLYELNRLKSDFLATMSHELRTPLNSIIGFSDVLDSIKSLDDKQRRYVQNIQKSGRVLLDMINDILDLAKIESGKMEVRLSEFRVEHVISAQCDMARPLTERKNIDLETEIAVALPPLYQDQGKVQQIINNLLSNAIKFTPEGGRIVVAASGDPSTDLLISVIDTGVGIAEEDQVAIFEKFRQGKAVLARGDAITRDYSGTGLGLSIVKELCKLLGGEITLQSELGKGSAFTVRLPWTRPHVSKLDNSSPNSLEDTLRLAKHGEAHGIAKGGLPANGVSPTGGEPARAGWSGA